MPVKIAVPPVPEGLHPAGCWRKMITGVDPAARGGYKVLGELLSPGDTVEVPVGALVLAVDKATRGWEIGYETRRRVAVEDATVTVYLASAGGLAEVWSRQYITSKSAFGATTMKQIARLLAGHPVPSGGVVVVEEARRPNRREGVCRWCGRRVAQETGHVSGHGADAKVEHYRECPTVPVQTGDVCVVCDVEVVSFQAAGYYSRKVAGKVEVRHKPVNGATCWEEPIPSPQEQQAALAARDAAERERLAAARARETTPEQAKRARAAKREAAKVDADRAEQARVAELAIVSTATSTLFDKDLGEGRRACLEERVLTLSDGSTTKRWSVRTYCPAGGRGGDDDFGGDEPAEEVCERTRLDHARADYQALRYQRPQRGSYRRSGAAEPAGSCAECGAAAGVVERLDSSGIAGKVCYRCDRQNPDDYMLSFA